ncbi:hypothetical protein Scep_025583 [Stephania cephalantha]|uniref:Uncharacterized protein n=1 Tax=Stephania cephalantha TaxID=152367 RepID=A0AAP0EIZ2_9MAGN
MAESGEVEGARASNSSENGAGTRPAAAGGKSAKPINKRLRLEQQRDRPTMGVLPVGDAEAGEVARRGRSDEQESVTEDAAREAMSQRQRARLQRGSAAASEAAISGGARE